MKKLLQARNEMRKAENNEKEYLRLRKQFLTRYFKERKKYEYSFFARMPLGIRKKIHPFLILLVRINNRLHGRRYHILFDYRKPTNKPKIFAITHIAKADIEIMSPIVKEPFFLLTDSFEECYKTIDGIMLAANGVIYFNRFVKKDRQLAIKRMVSVLKQGGNIIYFPEGVWNFTQNLPILPLNWGIIRVAKAGGAEIIPMAVEQYEKRFEICVGENFSVDNYGEEDEEIKRATADLRDIMATLKYSIWLQEKRLFRAKIAKNYWNKCTTAWIDGFPVTEEEVLEQIEDIRQKRKF